MIEKAPIIESAIVRYRWGKIPDCLSGVHPAPIVYGDVIDQRDDDHLYYLKQFAKWLKKHSCRDGLPHYCPNCDNSYYGVSDREVQALLKGGEDEKSTTTSPSE